MSLNASLNASALSSPIISAVSGVTTAVSPSSFKDVYHCSRVPDSQENFTLRLIALATILVTGLLFGSLPWLCRSFKLQEVFFYSSIFAGGVLLATGFAHILPEADADLRDPCLGLSSDFPWAFIISGASLIATFTLEYYLRALIRGALSRRYHLGEDLYKVVTLSHDFTAYVELGISDNAPSELSLVQRAHIRDQKVAAIMLEAGVLFHSFFIGLDIGVTSDRDYVRSLMIAIAFQQGFEGLALGSTFIRAHFSTAKYFLLLGAFVLMAPTGIGIGLGVSRTYNDNNKLALAFQGIFNSISSGILMYNGLVDVLLPAFSSSSLLVSKIYKRLMATTCLVIGFAIMSVLAKWA